MRAMRRGVGHVTCGAKWNQFTRGRPTNHVCELDTGHAGPYHRCEVKHNGHFACGQSWTLYEIGSHA